jgi:hypothetical protein
MSRHSRHDVIEALARYTEALEDRNGDAMAELFTPNGQLQLYSRYGRDKYIAAGAAVVGRDALRAMIQNAALAPGEGMHYATTDHVVHFAVDEAWMRARFLVMRSVSTARPDAGWPGDAELMQGKLSLYMVGFYDSRLSWVDGKWLFARHEIRHSLPMSIPQGA